MVGGGGYGILVLWKTMENWLRYCCKDLVRTHKGAREGFSGGCRISKMYVSCV